jgi:hypothetical protein
MEGRSKIRRTNKFDDNFGALRPGTCSFHQFFTRKPDKGYPNTKCLSPECGQFSPLNE